MVNEWPTVRIDEIAEKIAMGPFGSNIKVETFVETGVPVISGAHLRNVRLEDGDFNFVTDEHAEKMKNSNAFRGDVIFTHAGNIGQVAYIPPNSQYERYVISQRQFYLRCDLNKADPAFVSYFFHSNEGQHKLLANASQTGVPSIARPSSYLKTIEFSLPPLTEQRAITHILGTLDDKIELNRKQNETLEAMARALFKAWFVDFEPVRAKMEGHWQRGQSLPGLPAQLYDLFPDRLVESELGEIPEGWFVSTLGNELKKLNGLIQTGPFGSQLHASDYSVEGVPVVMPKDLVERRVSILSVARIPLARTTPLARHRMNAGDIVYSRRGDVERFAVVSQRENGWLCGTGCLLVRPGPNWKSTAFLAETLDHPSTREWIVRHAIGATMPNLNTKILGNVPLLVPIESVLIAFEQQCASWQKKREAADAESETLAQLRDTLLPKLISGALRIKDAETFLKERGL